MVEGSGSRRHVYAGQGVDQTSCAYGVTQIYWEGNIKEGVHLDLRTRTPAIWGLMGDICRRFGMQIDALGPVHTLPFSLEPASQACSPAAYRPAPRWIYPGGYMHDQDRRISTAAGI
jgi:hypothetical protein